MSKENEESKAKVMAEIKSGKTLAQAIDVVKKPVTILRKKKEK